MTTTNLISESRARRVIDVCATALFFVTLAVYWLTTEPTASFWDCPEYITTATMLEIGHPPGNPTWSLAAADFSRNAYLSIFSCPSIQKGGKISAIVPMVSHVDHSEHSVKVIATEQGIADLRGKDPRQRAETIIENCVHPMYKELMWDYMKLACKEGGHIPHNLKAAFALHETFMETGDMSQTDLARFA